MMMMMMMIIIIIIIITTTTTTTRTIITTTIIIIITTTTTIIIIIMIIELKGLFEIFYNLLTAPRTVSNTYPQVARTQSCANHVQHIERLSRAACRVACHVVRRDSSAINSDGV